MKPFAYHFRRLRVDLTRGRSDSLPIDQATLRESIGGSGLGVELLSGTESAELDPLDPQSSIFFVFSPLVGSPLTTSAKFAVVSKSPLTQRINDSLAGSAFAIAGKKTGFDAIEIVGKSATPILIQIENDRVQLVPCPELWGTRIQECENRLASQYGPSFKVACIGPAGENQVLFATISHDGRHAGRGGSGAVLGSKNVKAILVKGDQRVQWAQPDELNEFAKQLSKRSFEPATAKYRELGTAANLLVFNRLNCLPTRNFQEGQFAEAERLSPEALRAERSAVRKSCAACTIGCEHLYSLKKKEDRGRAGSNASPNETANQQVRLEYESQFALGPMCGVSDPEVVLTAAQLCDEYGMDSISTGATISFAMECSERGWISEEIRFGSSQDLLEAIHQMAVRTGLGGRLANGSRRMAGEIGGQAIQIAPQIKGLEIPGYDPRKLTAMALGFAVGTRGADHNKSSAYEIDFESTPSDPTTNDCLPPFPDSKIERAIELENRNAVIDSMIFCKFLRGVFADFFTEAADILNLVTGLDYTSAELNSIGAELVNRKKEFNIRAGWTPVEDTLPQRFFEKTGEKSQASYSKSELETAIRLYNLKRGWTAEGYLKEPHHQGELRGI